MKKSIKLIALFLCLGLGLQLSAQEVPCDCPLETNLVTNPNFSAGNTGFYSDFDLNSNCGVHSYSVEQEARDKCNNSGWQDDLWDHTVGNSTGWWQVIDGPSNATGYAPNRAWYQKVSVVAGQNYKFSFWVMPRISSVSSLNLRAFAGGVDVSGLIVPPQVYDWQEYCFDFTATTTGSIELSINQVNNFAYGGYEYGLDDIYFGTCPTEPDPCKVSAKYDVEQDPNTCKFTFTDFSAAGPGTTILGYSWNFGDGSTSTDQNPCHFFENPGVYVVCLTVYAVNEAGECCTDTFCQEIENPCEAQDCKVKIEGIKLLPSLICDLSVDVVYQSNHPIAGVFWNFGDGGTGTGTPATHTYGASGVYEVCVTVVAMDGEKCCSDTYCEKFEVFCQGLDEDAPQNRSLGAAQGYEIPAAAKALKVSPNPAGSQINLEFDAVAAKVYQVNIMNLQGQIMMHQEGVCNDSKEFLNINTSSLSPGTYFIKLAIDGKLHTEKLIIH